MLAQVRTGVTLAEMESQRERRNHDSKSWDGYKFKEVAPEIPSWKTNYRKHQ